MPPKDTAVERVVFGRDQAAAGVQVSASRDAPRRIYRATREVVLAGGVFGSPRSGTGSTGM